MSPAALLLLTLLIETPRPAPPGAIPSPAVPRFAPAPCPVEVASDERIDCGVLLVPENRAKPGSRTLRLPVMIFRSRSSHPAPDPLLFLAGGPGVSAVARRRSGKGLPFLDERDFIVLEQRGTRHAQPALECPGINALTAEIGAGRLRGDAARTAFVDAAAACRKALVAAGADLDAYTSAASADDVEDLRKALGYAKWNLFGISYGTRLALTVLRRHPAGVRAVVLDSVLPPEASFDEGASQHLLRALGVVFDGCAVDRECSIAFPDLRERFSRLVAAADREPLALAIPPAEKGGPPVVVRGALVVDAVYAALHDSATIPLIPRIVGSAAAGRTDELAPLVAANQGPSRMSWGMRLSVWCAEEMPFERPERIAAQLSPSLGLGGIDETTTSPEACRAWGVAAAPAVENEPVKSDVPTLVFAGDLDPDTPPDWGRRLLVSMPNARYVELRGMSHGAGSSPCGTEISRAFLANPLGPLDAGCSLRLRGADFSLSARPRGEK